MASTRYRVGAFVVALAAGSLPLHGQAVSVWRKVSPPPASRQEWVAPQTQSPGPGWIPDPRSRPGMTAAEARVAADLSRMGSDFTQACDRSYRVARDISGKPSVQAGAAAIPGAVSWSVPQCCEDAFNNAFPTRSGANDCRGLDLFSTPGRIMLGPAGFVSTTGGTVVIPSAPPIAVPPGTFTVPASTAGGTNDWHVWRRIDRPPSSRSDWYTVSKVQPPGFERAPEDKPNLTFAEASAIADAAILGPIFTRVCERTWLVWKNNRTGKLETARNPTAQTFGFDPWTVIQGNLCCEEAFNLAFPGNFAGSDCRHVHLRSGTNLIITPNGPVALSAPSAPAVTAMPNPFETGPARPAVPSGQNGRPVSGGVTMPMPGGGPTTVPPGITNPPVGPAGSLPLVKTEMLRKDESDRLGNGVQFSQTTVLIRLNSDERGSCGGVKDTREVQWSFDGAPGSLPRGGQVTINVSGRVNLCPDTENNRYWLNYSAGVRGIGLNVAKGANAYFYQGKSNNPGTFTFNIPATAESARIEYWADGAASTFVRYYYGKVN